MAQTKEELISDLYGLRAGLSLIAQKVDKEKIVNNALEHHKRELKSNNCLQKSYKEREKIESRYGRDAGGARYRSAKNGYENALAEYENRAKMSFKEKVKADGLEYRYGFDEFLMYFGWSVMIAFGVVIILSFVCSILQPLYDQEFEMFDEWVRNLLGIPYDGFLDVLYPIILVFIETVILGVVFGALSSLIVFPIVRKKYFSGQVRKVDREYFRRSYDAHQEYREAEEALKEAEDLMVDWNRDYEKALKTQNDQHKIAQERVDVYEKERMALLRDIQALERGLEIFYNSKIAKSDWANVDLLIHYLQTGRADSMKEALQLVDRQKQTDQITRAIYDAGNYVADTVRISIRQLGDGLAKSFSVISAQLSDIQSGIAQNNAKLDSLTQVVAASALLGAKGNQRVSEQISMQIKATDLQNALLEKANVSSSEMVKELQSIKRALS